MDRPARKLAGARARLETFLAAALVAASLPDRASADPVVATVADATLFGESGDSAADAQRRPALTITYDAPASNDVPLPLWAYAALAAGMLGVGAAALRTAPAPAA